MKQKIGFEVKKWYSAPIDKYTNEELLEYWYKLRFSLLGEKEVSMTHYLVQDIQEEIIRRMERNELCR